MNQSKDITKIELPIYNPYDIDLPAVVSFSGGRTSGYLLRHVLDAKGGQPEGLRVCFQNTGLEHEKTLEFIHDVETNWGINVEWLEYDLDKDKEPLVKVVNYETASRKGEPFTKMIEKYGYLPNVVARICTANLKVRTLWRHLKAQPGFEDGWVNAMGLRADEPRRVLRLKADSKAEEPECPLYHAGVVLKEVDDWWEKQDFNLNLPGGGNMAGNCVGCFLKSAHKLEQLHRMMPEYFEWWRDAEKMELKATGTGGKFRKDRMSYAELEQAIERQPVLFEIDTGDTIPCMCTD